MSVTALRKPDRTAAARAKRYRHRKRQGDVTAPAVPSRRHGDHTVTAAVMLAAFILAGVSGTFSIAGYTTIFPGAFLPIVAMAGAFELGKLAAVAWLGRVRGHWPVRLPLMALVGILMAFNAVGAFGYLSKVHIGPSADLGARRDVQADLVGDLDRRIAQVDAAVNEATRRGRTITAMALVADQAHRRDLLLSERQHQAAVLAAMTAATVTDDGPLNYLATMTGTADATLICEFILSLALMLDPLAVALLLAATSGNRR